MSRIFWNVGHRDCRQRSGEIETDLDELFKSFLFGRVVQDPDGEVFVPSPKQEIPEGSVDLYPEINDPNQAGPTYSEERHIFAQQQVDKWRYVPRQAGKTITVANFIQQLLDSGRVSPDDMDGIETQDQLLAKLAKLGIL